MRGGNRYRRLYSGITYDPAAVALFAAMTTPPTQARKALIDQTIRSLKSAGVWARLDVMWCLAAHNAQAARLNWITPGSFGLTAVSSPTFTADRGYTGDGASSYLSSTFQPGISGAATQDDVSLSAFALTSTVAASTDIGNTASHIRTYNAGNTGAESRLMSSLVSDATVAASGRKMVTTTRSGAASYDIYINGALGASQTRASIAPTAAGIFVLARNIGSASELSARQVAFGASGRSLSADQNAALYTAINTYLTAIGA